MTSKHTKKKIDTMVKIGYNYMLYIQCRSTINSCNKYNKMLKPFFIKDYRHAKLNQYVYLLKSYYYRIINFFIRED